MQETAHKDDDLAWLHGIINGGPPTYQAQLPQQQPDHEAAIKENTSAVKQAAALQMQQSQHLHDRDLQAHQQLHQAAAMKHDAEHQQLMGAQSGNNHLLMQMSQLLAANTQVQEQVKQSLDELASIVNAAVDTVTNIMKSPKDLVFDARGRPTGVKHKESQPQLTEGEDHGNV